MRPRRPRQRWRAWSQSQEREQLRPRTGGNGSDQRQATGEQQGDAPISESSQRGRRDSRRSRGWPGDDLRPETESVHHTPHCPASASATRIASGAAVAQLCSIQFPSTCRTVAGAEPRGELRGERSVSMFCVCFGEGSWGSILSCLLRAFRQNVASPRPQKRC